MTSSRTTSESEWLRAWDKTRIDDLRVELFVDGADPLAMSWLIDLYRRFGALSRDEVRVVFVLEQISVADDAVALVIGDIVRTTDLLPTAVVDELDWGVRITIFDGYTSPSMDTAPFRRAVAYAEVADYVQAQMMMSGDAGLVWPVCPDHGYGLHAAVYDDAAVWLCEPHKHVVSCIGELQQATPTTRAN